MFRRNISLYFAAIALIIILAAGCGKKDGEAVGSFIQIGEFAVKKINPDLTQVRDGAGRNLYLIPRGEKAPEGVPTSNVVEIPIKRVVVYHAFDIAVLRALGVLDEALVGVMYPMDRWYVNDVREGLESGKIQFLGYANSIDFEKMQKIHPDLVLTWDPSIIPMLDELGIACAVTSTPTAMCLNARMRFVHFLAPFFQKEKEADAFFARVNDALKDIRQKTALAGPTPKVIWGDVYEKRVLVEPGNAWVGELIGLAQSDYLFEDVYGTSCIEIAVERFLYSGDDADILFTYRGAKEGVTSKAALARLNPLLADIRPVKEGRVFSPLPHYSQSGDRLDEILTEIASILHPEVYSDYQRRFFTELPETDPEEKGGRS